MVTDQEIASCVESILRQQPDAASSSGSGIVRQVEEKLGVDLSHKAAFISDQIDLIRGPAAHNHAQQQQQQQMMQPPPPSPHQFLIHPGFYQMPPGSYPIAFHLPPAVDPSAISPQQQLQQQLLMQQQLQQQLQQQHLQQQHQKQQIRPPAAPPAAARQPAAVANSKISVPARIKRRRGPGGLTRLCGVSPELQVIVGEPAMPRTEIVKQLWAYIRKNNLQDPNNKRKIICNDELRLVLETDCTDIFKMNKLLAKHITPLEPTKDAAPDSKKLKAEGAVAEAEAEPDANPCPMVISDALTEFLGTGEKELVQPEALRRVWNYIKDNQLEDPESTTILCDPKLQQLFGCETLASSVVSEMLSCHLFEKS